MLQSYGYFNSGVALINLKKWREENLYVKFREFVNKHQDRILCSDQDILNYVLRKDKLELPLTYNFQDAFMVVSPNLPRISWTKEQEICNASMDPCIVHFSTKHSKPWFKDCGSPYQKEFIKYLKLTEWANMPLKIRPRTKKELIKIFLKQIGLLKWSYGIEYKKLPIQE